MPKQQMQHEKNTRTVTAQAQMIVKKDNSKGSVIIIIFSLLFFSNDSAIRISGEGDIPRGA